jgi:phenylalanyl-tRNA synthetase alpha chain
MRSSSRRTTPPATCRTRSTSASRTDALPDEQLVDHASGHARDGGDTGSTGWQYRWSREMAHKPVLRTHTTAATIRALARHAQGQPGKYFVIGPVFRRETVDYKHLPVFHQVDGIIVDPHASLATLIGTLRRFMARWASPRSRSSRASSRTPSPRPRCTCTWRSRQDWVEMGGSGIFRPEVTEPLGVKDRVLAWGLGLDRLAMLEIRREVAERAILQLDAVAQGDGSGAVR